MHRSFLAATVLSVTLLAAKEAESPALVLTLPQLETLGQRLAGGPYGRIWQLPAVQRWYADLAKRQGAGHEWMGLGAQAQALYSEVQVLPWWGGMPALETVVGLRGPAGLEPATMSGGQVQRQDAWWLLGLGGKRLTVPHAAEVEGARGGEDLAMVVDLPAWTRLLPAADAQSWIQALDACGVRQVQALATADTHGVTETITALGARLPLRPIDPVACAGLPMQAQAVLVLGLDGKGLAQVVGPLLALFGYDVQELDADLKARAGCNLADMASALDGTIVMALMPSGGFVLSLPANKATDGLVSRFIDDQDPGAGAQAITAATEQPIAIPSPKGMALSIRRSFRRWCIGTDLATLAVMGSDDPPAYGLATHWPVAEQAVALAWCDTGAVATTLLRSYPQAELATAAVLAAATQWPPAHLVATYETQGLRLTGRDALTGTLIPLLASARVVVPGMLARYRLEAQDLAQQHMRRIINRAIAFSKAKLGPWPADLAALRAAEPMLDASLFANPGHPEIAQPFCYVCPEPNPPSEQPVLVQDPACNDGAGSEVVYADGRSFFKAGTAMWDEAQRLIALPKTKESGVELEEWRTVPKSF